MLISKHLLLLDELFQIHKCKPTIGWKQSFQEYLQTVPSYYYDVSTPRESLSAEIGLYPTLKFVTVRF